MCSIIPGKSKPLLSLTSTVAIRESFGTIVCNYPSINTVFASGCKKDENVACFFFCFYILVPARCFYMEELLRQIFIFFLRSKGLSSSAFFLHILRVVVQKKAVMMMALFANVSFLERNSKSRKKVVHQINCKNASQCLKITQNVALEFFNFGIFHQFLTY